MVLATMFSGDWADFWIHEGITAFGDGCLLRAWGEDLIF